MSDSPFRINALKFRDQLQDDIRGSLRRPPDIRVEVHERHVERFAPVIYHEPPGVWDRAFHRQSYLKTVAKDSIERVERRHQLEVRTRGKAVESYRLMAERIDKQTLMNSLRRLHTGREYLARQRFGGSPTALPVRGSLQDQLNDERQMNHMATVIFERNPHAFSTDPVLKLAGLPAYSWPQITDANLTAVSVSIKA